MEPFRCYVTQWGCQISQKSVTMVYSSMLLYRYERVGGCQICRKKPLHNRSIVLVGTYLYGLDTALYKNIHLRLFMHRLLSLL